MINDLCNYVYGRAIKRRRVRTNETTPKDRHFIPISFSTSSPSNQRSHLRMHEKNPKSFRKELDFHFKKNTVKTNFKINPYLIDKKILEHQFNELASKWRSETGGYSTTYQIVNNKNYIDIIGMGKDALPFIVNELNNNPKYWFVALDHILKPDKSPVKKEHYGYPRKMAQDWLQWIDAEKRYAI